MSQLFHNFLQILFPDVIATTIAAEISCGTNEFACTSKPSDCMDIRWKCDGDPDCDDGSDEEGCPTTQGLDGPSGRLRSFLVDVKTSLVKIEIEK